MNIFQVSEDGTVVPPVIIFSTSKTGGNTFRTSLNNLRINNCFTHFLGWDEIAKSSSAGKEHRAVMISAEIMSTIDCLRGKARMKVITSIREPITKDISGVFHAGFHSSKRMRDQFEGMMFDEAVPLIHETLLKRLRAFDENANVFCTWFDRFLKPVFDFDIYSQEFDKEKGYQIYHAKDADILCFKLEKLRDCHKEAFEEFLGVKDFQLVNDNSSSTRYYGELYQRTVNSLEIPEDILDRIYNSRTARHFYSAREIEGFRAKWFGPKVQAVEPFAVGFKKTEEIEQFNAMGKRYFASGDHVGALRQFSMALKLNPVDKQSILNCTRTLVHLADIETAIKICSDYLSVVAVDSEVADILNILNKSKKSLV